MAFVQVPVHRLHRHNGSFLKTSTSIRPSPVMSASPMNRRSVLRLAALSLGTLALTNGNGAHAFSLKDKAASDNVKKIKSVKNKVVGLKDMVSGLGDKVKDEDILVVLRFIPIWLTPVQIAAAELPDMVNPAKADVEKLKSQALLMKGHLLELSTEAKNGSKQGIIRELDEILETIDDISELAKKI